MNKRLYKYTQEFFRQSPSNVVGREIKVIKVTHGELPLGYRAKIISSQNGRYLVKCDDGRIRGKYNCDPDELEFIASTKEEFGLLKEDIIDSVAEIDEKLGCLKDLGVDNLEPSTFSAWKLVKDVEAEPDKTKRKDIIVSAVSALYNKQKS